MDRTTIKGVIFGPSGIGKTSLLHTLPPEETLVLDLEAGLLAAEGWGGDSIPVRTWAEARLLASVIGGPNPSSPAGEPYSKEYYDRCVAYAEKQHPDLNLAKYRTVFIDSITEASRLCLLWAQSNPESFTKDGKLDMRKCYGTLGQEMVKWFKQLQHVQGKNVWLVGILDRKQDDSGQMLWEPQMEGSKAPGELPGIFDQVITMTQINVSRDGKNVPQRAFICQKLNPWGYPAKDRSGRLNLIEKPHLGELMEKIRTAPRHQINPDWAEILEDQIIY